jgi:hypothetical protein
LQAKPHALPTQDGFALATPVVQTLPHIPQSFAFVVKSTQVPLHSVWVPVQPVTQTDAVHTGVPAAHAWPQEAQLFLSLVVSTQAPLQRV